MEEGGIGLVLARATELRLKINNCVHKTATQLQAQQDPLAERLNGVHGEGDALGDEEEEEEEAQRLLNISDALESLENQLSSLQDLQQQQRYEREVALAEIEQSRKLLLDKLKEYKGEDLDVIHEASAFVGETVEHSNDLLFPPYPSRRPNTISLENGYVASMLNSAGNGVINSDGYKAMKKNLYKSEDSKTQSRSKNSKGMGLFLGAAAKTMFAIVGVVSVLSLSGLGPKIVKKDAALKVLSLLKQPTTEENRSTINCPPGKILVMENGEARYLVKERVEVPFSSVVAKPDVNFGCG